VTQAPKRSADRDTISSKSKNQVARIAPPQRWVWPTDGPLLRPFFPDNAGKKGIDIGGGLGQSVRAASEGKVVYSGSGLIGYGKLIIIKHNKTYLSAYAHNRRLLVKEGDYVRIGQRIAELGNTATEKPMLHFEIRRNGEPVDPLRYLPARSLQPTVN
jgi:lipoprotein NlpD